MSTELIEETTSHAEEKDDRFSAGDWLYWMCEFEKAQEHFQAVLKQPTLSTSNLARCYKSLGAIEVELKKYDDALNIYNQQLDVLMKCSSANTKEEIMLCYISIGKVYWLKHNYEQAIDHHKRALEFAQSIMDCKSRISTIYKNLANIYTNIKQFELALEHFQKALDIDSQHLREGHPKFGQTYANMGIMYQSQKNYNEALAYFEQAREIFLKTLPLTHPLIKKTERIIDQMKSKLAENKSNIELSLDTQPVNAIDILTPNNVMIIWLDEHIGRDENCRDLKNEFQQITKSFKMVDSVDSCRQCLPHVKNRKVFFIIQGKYAKEIVPDIVQIISPTMKPVVYIFCLHIVYLSEWAQEQECIMEGGMFDHEKDLLARLSKDLSDYVKQETMEYNKSLESELISKFLSQFTQVFERCCRAKAAIVSSSHEIGNDRSQTATITT